MQGHLVGKVGAVPTHMEHLGETERDIPSRPEEWGRFRRKLTPKLRRVSRNWGEDQ